MCSLENIEELRGLDADLVRFGQALAHLASVLSLDLSRFQADHISLRCNQRETAERWRRGFLRCAELLAENTINGRPVCLFDLARPLQVGPWLIDCVELPYPGEKHYPHQGWQHVELVLEGPPETLHSRALALLPDEGLLAPGIRLTFSQPQADGERLPNPTLAVGDRLTTVKFHPYSLREIVASERS